MLSCDRTLSLSVGEEMFSTIHALRVLALGLLVASTRCRAQPMMIDIGLPPGATEVYASALSADGSTVLGLTDSGEYFVWRAASGFTMLNGQSWRSLNENGSVAVGGYAPVQIGPNPSCQNEIRTVWRAGSLPIGGTPVPLYAPSALNSSCLWGNSASLISANGSTIVGSGPIRPAAYEYEQVPQVLFLWRGGGFTMIPPMFGATGIQMRAISASGDFGTGVSNGGFLWSASGGIRQLGTLPNTNGSTPEGISGDGKVIVGTCSGGYYGTPFRWTASHGMRIMNAGGAYHPWGGVDFTGETSVGALTAGSSPIAGLQTELLGVVGIADFLNQLGSNTSGWSALSWASGISSDANIILCQGMRSGVGGYRICYINMHRTQLPVFSVLGPGPSINICGATNAVVECQATPSGAGPYLYQWQIEFPLSIGGGWYDLWDGYTYSGVYAQGTKNAKLRLSSVSSAGIGAQRIRCRIMDLSGRAIVTEPPTVFDGLSPAINSQPSDVDVNAGDPISLHVGIVADDASANFQWRKNGEPISTDGPDGNPSAKTATFSIPSARLSDIGDYDCIVFNACGTVQTRRALVEVQKNSPSISLVVRAFEDARPAGHVYLEFEPGNGEPRDLISFIPSKKGQAFCTGLYAKESNCWSWKLQFKVTDEAYLAAIEQVRQDLIASVHTPPQYNVISHNCFHWAMGVVQHIGINMCGHYTCANVPSPWEFQRQLEVIGDGAAFCGGTVVRNPAGLKVTDEFPFSPDVCEFFSFGFESPWALGASIERPADDSTTSSVIADAMKGLAIDLPGWDLTARLLGIDWGDGSPTELAEPSMHHIYSPGSYTAKVLAIDDSAVQRRSIPITVGANASPSVVVSFNWYPPISIPNIPLVPAEAPQCVWVHTRASTLRVCGGTPAPITVSTQTIGDTPLTYQWRKNGIPINSSTNPSAAMPTLNLPAARGKDSGSYDCRVTGSCDTVVSNASILKICDGDITCDEVIDDADFVAFLPAYDMLICDDPSMPAGCPADFNGDGLVDDIDFQIFSRQYNDLLCPD